MNVNFEKGGSRTSIEDLGGYIDRKAQVVRASNGQLKLDYGDGVLTIDSPRAQGISGVLNTSDLFELSDITISSGLDLGHVVLVSLDGEPLVSSRRMLLQAMSEEMATGFEVSPADDGKKEIVSLGKDPWRVKNLTGAIEFSSTMSAGLRVTELDLNGRAVRVVALAEGGVLNLSPSVVYYLVER